MKNNKYGLIKYFFEVIIWMIILIFIMITIMFYISDNFIGYNIIIKEFIAYMFIGYIINIIFSQKILFIDFIKFIFITISLFLVYILLNTFIISEVYNKKFKIILKSSTVYKPYIQRVQLGSYIKLKTIDGKYVNYTPYNEKSYNNYNIGDTIELPVEKSFLGLESIKSKLNKK